VGACRSGILGIALVAGSAAAIAQRPLNLDFERPGVALIDRPWGWVQGFSPFLPAERASFALDSSVRHSGLRSLRIAIAENAADVPVQFLRLQVPAGFASGRHVTLHAWTRADGVRRRALVALEAWAPGRTAAADTAVVPAPTSDWTRQVLAIRVDSTAHSLVLSVALDGPGTAWFDHFELTVDGTPVRELATGPPAAASDVRWLAQHATPLRDVRPSAATDDEMERFNRIVGDARVVGLGESTHGTREFFLVKHRLLEYLARRQGFAVFAIEANQIAVRAIDEYVQGRGGTARDVMRTMFRVWNTESMRELIEWMRAFNAANPACRSR
jgi:erythromycin esterase